MSDKKLKDQSVAIGVFDNPSDARAAVKALIEEEGFSKDEVGVLAHDKEGDVRLETVEDSEGAHPGTGAAIGAAAGAGGAALWALGIAAGILPAIGPVIAGGVLAAVLASAAAGAAAGTVVGALVGLGVDDEDAQYYQEEFEKGRTIILVNTDVDRLTTALLCLDRHHGYRRDTASKVTTPTDNHGHSQIIV